MTKKFVLALAVTATAAVAAGSAGADVSQTPVATGCPAGYAHPSVASLLAAGPYFLAAALDSPSNGGNGNGYVCAHALPDAVRDAACARGDAAACVLQQLGQPLYDLKDDSNPASLNAQAGG